MKYILLAISLIAVCLQLKKCIKNVSRNRFGSKTIDKGKKKKSIQFYFVKHVLKKSDTYIKELDDRLQWVGIDEDVYKYVCKPYIAFLGSILFGAVLAWVSKSQMIVAYGMIVIGFLIGFINYAKYKSTIKQREKEKKMNVVLEMPRFIKTIQYSPPTKSLDHILMDYIPNAKKGLKSDLVLLLANMKAGMSEKDALKRFANKINIPEVTELVYILDITGSHSTNAKVSLQFLGSKFRERSHYLIEKELSKRPEKLAVLNDLLLHVLALLILVPVAINAFDGIQNIIK